MSSLDELDANFVLDVQYDKSVFPQLIKELEVCGCSYEVRPGTSEKNVSLFIRDNSDVLPLKVEKYPIVKSVIPFRNFEDNKRLERLVGNLNKEFLPSINELVEIAAITNNPGIALYFAFQRSYTLWLISLGLVGLAFRLFTRHGPWEFSMFYSIAVLVWGMAFAVDWKYRSEPLYSKRLGYKTAIPTKDSKSVFVKKLCFIPIAISFTACLVSFQFVCFFIEIYFTQLYQGPFSSILSLVPVILLSAYVPVLTSIYNIFVRWLVKWENGPNPDKSKAEKSFVLLFLTSYVPLLITFFVYLPLGHKLNPRLGSIAHLSKQYRISVIDQDFKLNTSRYKTQFFYFIVTNQIIALCVENLLPIVMGKIMPIISRQNSPTSAYNRAQQLINEKYPNDSGIINKANAYNNSPWGKFDVDANVRKMVIQFGYIVMFSTVWPIAPLICIILNIIISKCDMWRALTKHTPSLNKYATAAMKGFEPITLSPWNVVLEFLVWFASLVSPAIVIMYRNCDLPGVGYGTMASSSQNWFLKSPIRYEWKLIFIYVMIAEHLGLFLRYAFSMIASAPDSADLINVRSEKLGVLKEQEPINRGSIDEKYNNRVIHETEEIVGTLSAKPKSTLHAKHNTGATSAIGAEDTKTLHISGANNTNGSSTGTMTRAFGEDNVSGNVHPVPAPIPVMKQAPKTALPPIHTASEMHNTGPTVAAIAHKNTDRINSTKETAMPHTIPSPTNDEPAYTGGTITESNTPVLMSQSDAGATLPEYIPTSKNYNERQGHMKNNSSGTDSTTQYSADVNLISPGEDAREITDNTNYAPNLSPEDTYVVLEDQNTPSVAGNKTRPDVLQIKTLPHNEAQFQRIRPENEIPETPIKVKRLVVEPPSEPPTSVTQGLSYSQESVDEVLSPHEEAQIPYAVPVVLPKDKEIRKTSSTELTRTNTKKSSSIKNITKFISTPMKKDSEHSSSKSKHSLKSPLSKLKKKF
ncbi:HBL173Cp [Eremothecium sinecaudum]|uniref:HBL173Cp n=1 Tax=Eremothecium sinecaudum TaxID=45286 RepID=A0A109UWC9_9SACH|nr:HBL173Cp [Eremothecium sinecaudum]AMD18729.1 HBL173Cp [Eremothecium sinecaudum]